MTSRDDEEASEKAEAWRSTFNRTARSVTPEGMRAVRAGRSPSSPSASQITEVIELTRDLGLEVIKLVSELRGMKRHLRVQHVVGVLVALSLLVASYVMKMIHDEQAAARERDRAYLTQRIESARVELTTATRQAGDAAEQAADSARHAAIESLKAQIEAAEVQARISPPRERVELEAKIEEKKRAAEALGADL